MVEGLGHPVPDDLVRAVAGRATDSSEDIDDIVEAPTLDLEPAAELRDCMDAIGIVLQICHEGLDGAAEGGVLVGIGLNGREAQKSAHHKLNSASARPFKVRSVDCHFGFSVEALNLHA
jgi:hypothetical protein